MLHDDGRWYRGTILHAYRDRHGAWRAVVAYAAGPGFTYMRGVVRASLRAAST